MFVLRVKKHCERRLSKGHLWIFSNELEVLPDLPAGTLVKITDFHNTDYGVGFYNPNSLIAVRLLNSRTQPDTAWFLDKLRNAAEFRNRIFRRSNSYRLCFGESDYLPGLVIDKYEDCFAIQTLSAGMEQRLDCIIEAIKKLYPSAQGIIAKNETSLRTLESLELYEKVLYGFVPDEIITQENGISLSISISKGQKTGYFLDQRENRLFLRQLAEKAKVLDCYTNQGGFALNCAKFGAEKVTAVDTSQDALDKAAVNADLNGLTSIEFVRNDVGDFLTESVEKREKYDVIILDPPSFAKNKKSVPAAKAGYAKINRLAMEMLNRNGFLATASCSHVVKQSLKLRKNLTLIYHGSQSPDHPIHPAMPESKYLKFFVFRVL